MLIFGRAFSLAEISLMTEIQAVAEHYCTSIRDLTGVTPELTCSKAGNYKISIPTRVERLKILEYFGYTGKEITLRINLSNLEQSNEDCCSKAFLRGAFLVCGSVTDPEKDYHIELDDNQFDTVFNQIKSLGDKGKCITDDDLKAIALTELGSAREKPIKLKGLGLLCGAVVSPTATVKLEIDGVEKETSNTGVGPIDASLNAIRDLIQDTMDIELEEYNLEAINGGTDALADVFVISSDNEGNKSTGRAIKDDVVMASILAVLDSINKLLLIKRSSEELNIKLINNSLDVFVAKFLSNISEAYIPV